MKRYRLTFVKETLDRVICVITDYWNNDADTRPMMNNVISLLTSELQQIPVFGLLQDQQHHHWTTAPTTARNGSSGNNNKHRHH